MLSPATQAAPPGCQMGSKAWTQRAAAQVAPAGDQTSCGPQVSRTVRQASGLWSLRRCMQPALHTAQVLGVRCKPAALADRLQVAEQAGKLWLEELGLPVQMLSRGRQAAG